MLTMRDRGLTRLMVNAVAPGTIDSSYFRDMFAKATDPATFRRQLEQRHPMDGLGTPQEIAYAMLYLASDESSYTTGSLLFADGGMTAW
jgi:meso-butanediol dehydrogenase / (S,S)-butanediol dehydrogenase / diacetyl reductase